MKTKNVFFENPDCILPLILYKVCCKILQKSALKFYGLNM